MSIPSHATHTGPSKPTTPPTRAERWVRFADTHRKAVLLIAAIATLLGSLGGARLYSDLRPDVSELLPRNAQSARDLEEVTARVGGWAEYAVILTGAEKPVLKRFADDLNAKLEPSRPKLIRWIEYRIDDLAAFFKPRQWLFLSVTDLKEIESRLEARIRWEKQHANPLFVDMGAGDEKPPSFDDLVSRLKLDSDNALTRFPEGYYLGEAPGEKPGETMQALVMLVRMAGSTTDFNQLKQVTDAVHGAVADLDPHRYAPSLHVAYGGYVANTKLEHDALVEDLVLATALVLLAVAISIWIYFRSWRAVVLLGLPLATGAFVTFGVAYLYAGHLNSNTAFLGSIIVGNGINCGIILLARYYEERRHGRAALISMETAVSETWLATLTAALAAGVSYASLLATDFRGFSQFGFIGGIGMALCWLAAYIVLPPLALAWEARHPLVGPGETVSSRPLLMSALAHIVERAPRAVVLISVVVSILAALSVARFMKDPIEYDLTRLRDSRAMRTDGPGWWDQRIVAVFGTHLTPNVFLCRDDKEARAVTAQLENNRRTDPNTVIGSVTSVASFVPTDQEEKLPIIARIRALATPEVLAQVPEPQRAQLEAAMPPTDLKPFGMKDLPLALQQQLTEVDGRMGTPVLVYPSSKVNVFDGRDVLHFADALRAIPLPRADIPIASPNLVLVDVLRTIARDGPIATLLSFVGVLLFVLVAFVLGERSLRSVFDAMWVLGSLLIGVLWFLGIAGAVNLKLNMLNFIAVPITFGIGVDYATNLFQRKRQERSSSIGYCLRTTGGAIALCSLTTTIGYSSLLVARNQALNTFGFLADIGEAACLAAALLGLAAVLRWQELRAEARAGIKG